MTFSQNNLVQACQVRTQPVATLDLGDVNQSGTSVCECIGAPNHAFRFQLVQLELDNVTKQEWQASSYA